jgi:hypothetical protein
VAGLFLGIGSGAFIEILSTFDCKKSFDNLENVCQTYGSEKLIPKTIVSVIIIGL